MFRPTRTLCMVALALAAFAFDGCKTSNIYSDVYSPKRNRFVAVPDKKDAILTETPTVTPTTPLPPTITPGLPMPDTAPPPAVEPAAPAMAPEPAAPLPS